MPLDRFISLQPSRWIFSHVSLRQRGFVASIFRKFDARTARFKRTFEASLVISVNASARESLAGAENVRPFTYAHPISARKRQADAYRDDDGGKTRKSKDARNVDHISVPHPIK